ncbi:MAG: GDP-L-fucose synthase [Bacteriovorax sp.]|nr:GDP-L-fucose synthase [Bacteriovorax sp.]
MKILLTGGNGLVGKNIREHKDFNSYEFLVPVSKELNLLNKNDVKNYLEKHRPEMVIHCAGKVGGIQANMADMTGFLFDNLQMGLNLISSCQELKIPKVLNLASSCIYPKEIGANIKEEDLLTGLLEPTNEGYAVAKISVLKHCDYISKQFPDLSYKSIIPCNIYGRHDHFDLEKSHMVPAVIMRMTKAAKESQESIVIWGDGLARREFMYSEDLADAIFFAVKNFEKLPQNTNIGLGFDYSIKEYYETIAEVVGFKGHFEFDLTKPKGMQQKLLNIDKMKELGWKSQTDLKTGLMRSHDFYLNTLRG